MKDFFSFSNLLRFHAVNIKDFHSDLRATYTLNALQKLMQKDSFLATDATTQSSNQEEDETRKFLFFFLLQNNATRKNVDKNKTKRMKRKLWLKAQIANRIRAQKCKKAIKTTPILTLA
jgi:hypothetical protein